MSQTITYSATLETCQCWCGIYLAVPANLLRNAREEGTPDIYCPLGHKFGWHETEADRLRKKLERAEARRIQAEDQRKAAEKSNSALRGQLTKTRNRAKNGVCPCCNRSFVQLARHMKTQHPEFEPTA